MGPFRGTGSTAAFALAALLVNTALLAPPARAGLQATLTKQFSPATIGPGSVSTLSFTIANPAPSPLSMVSFADTLPAAVTIASPARATSTCGGTLSAPSGGTTIGLSDGGVGANSSCQIRVDVTSSTQGVHMNVTSELATSAGTAGSAAADLAVDLGLPGFTKVFSPSTVPLGARSTLTFTIDNSANDSAATSLEFVDDLPPGLVVADPSNASTDCATPPLSPTLTATPGAGVVSLRSLGSAMFPAIAAGSICSVNVDVVPTAVGPLGNTTRELVATIGGDPYSSGRAGAVLTATAGRLHLIKEIVGDPAPPGGTVSLELTVLDRDRDLAATGVTFTDDLAATLPGLVAVGLPLAEPCGPGSTLSGSAGDTLLTLAGGTVPAQGSCTFSITLQVPAAATQGVYPNTTSVVTGNFDGVPVLGNAASDDLFVFAAPVLTKTFLTDPVVAGDTATIEFTIANTSQTFTASGLAFLDELTTFLPFPISATLPAAGFCGPGSSMSLVGFGTEAQGLLMAGGELAAGDSCTFTVDVDLPPGLPSGTYVNRTGVITATVGGEAVTGSPATASFEVVGGVVLRKRFPDDPVAPGGTVTLQFEIVHDPNAPTDATGIAFTDDLNATLPGLMANGLPIVDVCGAGSQLGGSMGVLSFTGGTLAPGSSCQFSVVLSVPMAALAGSYPNSTSTVAATVGGLAVTTPAASDVLVVSGLSLRKEFTDDPAVPGGQVTLQFTISNAPGSPNATSISFQDDLTGTLSNLIVDPGSVPSNPCGAGSSIALLSGNRLLALQGGSLAGGETCQFDVVLDVPAATVSGLYPNATSGFFAIIDGGLLILPNAFDTLAVAGDVLQLTKTFLTNPVAPGAVVDLRFELTNLSLSGIATSVAFTDDLGAALSGLVAIGLPISACGGTLAATPDAGTLDFSGGTLPSGGSCAFTVTLQVPAMPASSSAVNTTSQVTGTIGAVPVTGDPASDTLRIQNVGFTKTFAGAAAAGSTPTLTFTIENLDAGPLSSLGFTDDLDAVLPGLVATGLPRVDVCGLGSTVSGTSFLTLSGGSLGGNASCSFDVTLQVPASASPGTYPNTTSTLSSAGLGVSEPATDALVIEPPPTFSKRFSPTTVGVGVLSILTFTVDNGASAIAASGLDFTDNLPAGLTVAPTPNGSSTCTGGTLTATSGAGVIAYTGGTVAAGASCTLQVSVVASASGVYVNVSGDLTSSSGNSGPASDALDVEPPPLYSKSFSPTTVGGGSPSTLTFTVDNGASAIAASGLDFTDGLPAGLTVAPTPSASSTCTGGTLTATPGAGVIAYTGGTVAAGAACTVQVSVVASVPGVYVNVSGDLTSSSGNSGLASDTLDVEPPPLFSKSFAPTAILVGEVSTLTLVADNTASTLVASGLDFTDNLPAGMTVAPAPNASSTCAGGTLTADAGAGVVVYTGGTVAAGATCTLTVDVVANAPGVLLNVAGPLTSSLGDSGTAEAGLEVAAVQIPTLGGWALLLLVTSIAGLAVWRSRAS